MQLFRCVQSTVKKIQCGDDYTKINVRSMDALRRVLCRIFLELQWNFPAIIRVIIFLQDRKPSFLLFKFWFLRPLVFEKLVLDFKLIFYHRFRHMSPINLLRYPRHNSTLVTINPIALAQRRAINFLSEYHFFSLPFPSLFLAFITHDYVLAVYTTKKSIIAHDFFISSTPYTGWLE